MLSKHPQHFKTRIYAHVCACKHAHIASVSSLVKIRKQDHSVHSEELT